MQSLTLASGRHANEDGIQHTENELRWSLAHGQLLLSSILQLSQLHGRLAHVGREPSPGDDFSVRLLAVDMTP